MPYLAFCLLLFSGVSSASLSTNDSSVWEARRILADQSERFAGDIRRGALLQSLMQADAAVQYAKLQPEILRLITDTSDSTLIRGFAIDVVVTHKDPQAIQLFEILAAQPSDLITGRIFQGMEDEKIRLLLQLKIALFELRGTDTEEVADFFAKYRNQMFGWGDGAQFHTPALKSLASATRRFHDPRNSPMYLLLLHEVESLVGLVNGYRSSRHYWGPAGALINLIKEVPRLLAPIEAVEFLDLLDGKVIGSGSELREVTAQTMADSYKLLARRCAGLLKSAAGNAN